jgi:hypothetical protein
MLHREILIPADYEYVMVFRHGNLVTCLPSAPDFSGGKVSVLRAIMKVLAFSRYFL